MDLGLQNKVALVAASSKGLGYGVARALAAEGARVSLCSRAWQQVGKAAATLRRETGADTLASECDVRDPAQIQAWVDKTVAAWGQVDCLLVNAGGPPAKTVKELSDADWQAAFELTLLSSIRMIAAALPHMRAGGSILTVTSGSVREPIPRLALSTVMRAGVAGLVKTLADELADDGIRVNNLVPGRIDTDRVAQLDANTSAKLGISIEEVQKRSLESIPLGRYGTIDDFGRAGAFLLSPAASYITGATLRVDGGAARAI
ncbi:MAG: SDR family oxidoreductase [Chloroflexota bacterium]|nr:SDR family oxidoreductase [Chloroflexota bacterium]MXV91911.1 SDR family oxidoreductase [Chloroflexota bacterium]MXX52293.1 SDR family oxidoreductase [Chloroflexota bacterium]MXX84382.1 SDR family oxidoreductase [Chloroflexota bacterium]MYA92840.1 SDR family oxidoreductase [Chloroflexota bacterium]